MISRSPLHRLILFVSPCSLLIALFCVQVTQKAANQDNEIRTLTKGDYFGEQVDNDDDGDDGDDDGDDVDGDDDDGGDEDPHSDN